MAFILAFCWIAGIAQNPIHKNAFAARALFVDYITLNTNEIRDDKDVTNGFELTYLRNLGKRVNLGIPLKGGLARFPNTTTNNTFFGLDGVLQVGLFEEHRTLVPYVTFGAGFVVDNLKRIDLQAPIGAGVNFNLYKGVYLTLEAQARISIEENKNNIHFGAGFLIQPGKYEDAKPEKQTGGAKDTDGDGVTDDKDACPDLVGSVNAFGCPDDDNDGIANTKDNCPDEAGLAAFDGCPDADGDGIIDKEDNCPKEYGPASNQGCPSIDADGDGVSDKQDDCPYLAGSPAAGGCPDSDGDGVADRDDDCPNVAGKRELRGCPDTDGDGIADKDDKCPNSAGPKENLGCPSVTKEDQDVLDFAMRAVQFESGKSNLKAESYPVLEQVAKILLKYQDYKVSIEGHTDNVGTDQSNLQLSKDRVRTCFDFLIFKGIAAERMTYAGFGESKPVSTNNTEEGRYLNRRVEFILIMPK